MAKTLTTADIPAAIEGAAKYTMLDKGDDEWDIVMFGTDASRSVVDTKKTEQAAIRAVARWQRDENAAAAKAKKADAAAAETEEQ
jgi:hypothetical protein